MDDKIIDDNIKKKIFLGEYLKYVQLEEMILQRIQALRLDKSCPSVTNDGMPHGNAHSDLSNYAVSVDEEIAKLKNIRDKRDRARRDILDRVKKLENKDEQILLRMVYIQEIAVDDAAVMLGVCRRKGYEIQNSAIKNLTI